MGRTAIEWCDETWNPVRGCSRVSEGCRHCYAEAMAGRIVRMGRGRPTPYDGLVRLTSEGEPRWTRKLAFDVEKLAKPLRWRKPKRVFVNSMSDLFHESLTNEQIAAVFGVMAACPHLVFIVLTKRSKRMREWFVWIDKLGPRDVMHEAVKAAMGYDTPKRPAVNETRWPLPNVQMGVSAENQDAADERIPDLLSIEAAVRIVSMEPLLGPIDASRWLGYCERIDKHGISRDDRRRHIKCERYCGISQVIVGCESGPEARPTESAWYRSLRDQCAATGTAFFFKQAREEGTWIGDSEHEQTVLCGPGSTRKPGGIIGAPYLDGAQHLEFARTEARHG